jgi:hypothetical protein
VVTNKNSQNFMRLEEDTSQRIVNPNPTVINNAASLPDFVHNGGQETNGGQGRTIVVNQPSQKLSSGLKTSSVTSTLGKKPTATVSGNKKK